MVSRLFAWCCFLFLNSCLLFIVCYFLLCVSCSCFLMLGFFFFCFWVLLSSLMLSTSPSEPKNQRRENLSENRPKLSPKVEHLFPATILPGFFLLGLGSVQPVPKPTDVFYSCVASPRTPTTFATSHHLTVEAMRFMNGLSHGFDVRRWWGQVESCNRKCFCTPKNRKRSENFYTIEVC